MNRLLVPIGGFAVLTLLAFTLIVAIMLRPWAGPDNSWRTHMNLTDGPFSGYTRSVQAFVSEEGSAPIQVWRLDPKATNPTGVEEGRDLFVAGGCASCHSLTGEGGTIGPDLMEVTASEIRKTVRNGPEGMPAFHDQDLTDDQLALIVDYLLELQVAKSSTEAPVASPEPTPAPVASGTPTPTPSPTAVSTPTPAAEPTPTPSSTPSPTQPSQAEPSPTATTSPPPPDVEEPSPTPPPGPQGIAFEGAFTTITVDGDTADWADIQGAQVTMQQIMPIPGKEMGQVDPFDVTLKVAADSENVYVLVEIPDDYDYVPDDHGLSAAFAVMFRIDEPAAPHMGTEEENQRRSLGMVDIWHWELDCGPGEVSGGGGRQGGNDPACNLDDEYATTPKDLEDDGTAQAENSLVGVWEHTARAQGPGAEGTWIFEISRPLQTGDPEDAQLQLGGMANMALAYWDADETPEGWSDLGHLQSASGGWIEVSLPTFEP